MISFSYVTFATPPPIYVVTLVLTDTVLPCGPQKFRTVSGSTP